MQPLCHPSLETSHGFFTRKGGVSTGIYGSLNCGLGSGDDPAAVAENRRRALAVLDTNARHVITLNQIHSNHCITITAPVTERLDGDALATKQRGIALGILTADCAPILFADTVAGVIGAAHAGWRGAFNDVMASTVLAMENLGAERGRITAVIGPCIQQASYEVDAGFYQNFLAQQAANEAFFVPSRKRPGHYHFDLPGYILAQLLRLRLGAVDRIARDTYAETEAFFSYRRTTLGGGGDYGRQISAIMLR
jgi:polyphenol oxidase